jgi:hypothetical protein
MARRHLTLTMSFTLDEDTVRDDDPERYEFVLDALRTGVHRTTGITLDEYDPIIESVEVSFHGVTYEGQS